MKKEIAEKWVEALRSGQYKQGRSYLKRLRYEVAEYCCLGVLSDISKLGGWNQLAIYNNRLVVHEYVIGKKSKYNLLLKKIIQWAGLKSSGSEGVLVSLNDGLKYSFTEIADYIEKNYKEL